MARPAVPQARKKSIKLSARFNAAEARIIAARAKEDGMTVSDELRRAVGLPPRRRDPEQQNLIHLLSRLLGEFGKQGSNLRQLLKMAYDGSWPETDEISRACQNVVLARETIMRALRVDHTDQPAP
jgi:mobilization protein NikA